MNWIEVASDHDAADRELNKLLREYHAFYVMHGRPPRRWERAGGIYLRYALVQTLDEMPHRKIFTAQAIVLAALLIYNWLGKES